MNEKELIKKAELFAKNNDLEVFYIGQYISRITAHYIPSPPIKRLLAYSSIENIGIIGLGIAVGMLGLAYSNHVVAIFGFAGGFLHVINHSIFKELLFFSAGNAYIKTHTRNIETLGGLIKTMPKTSFFMKQSLGRQKILFT